MKKESMNAFEYLKKVPLFADFSVPDLRLLGRIGTVRDFSGGEKIFDEDSSGDRLYVVVSGRVKIFTSSGVKNKILAYLERGEFFGEMSLLDREPRSASSIAADDCRLLVIKKKDFRALLAQYPRISFQVMKTLSRRLRQADREIESMAFGNVFGRVAGILLHLSQKYGEKTTLGSRIQMPLSHREIAELAGTSREVVSRILNRMRRIQCVAYTHHSLTITDASKLRSFIY